jgi:ABC-type dipeptide/oligopeptide/nickel transport system permease subunit
MGRDGSRTETCAYDRVMAEGRTFFRVALLDDLFPGIALSATVLSVNLRGDGLRTALDRRLARQL